MIRKLSMDELNRKTTDEFKKASKNPFVLVLDNVRSQNNIGSIFRTADAFLAEAIYLCGITSIPPNKEIHKTALGATDSVHWEYEKETLAVIKKLRQNNYQIVAFEQVEGGKSLQQFNPEKGKKYALVFGHEVHGIQQEVINASDLCIEIPQFGTKHSLNIAVSAGIAIWEFFRQIKLQDQDNRS
jgi:23S rRNA (guanosine2251-2'-O)-methyltransferase